MNFPGIALNLPKTEIGGERQRLTGGPTAKRDPLDSDTKTTESTSLENLDDGEVSGKTKGI